MNRINKLQSFTLAAASLLLFATPVFAAAPDGLGPWADKVISTHQGLQQNGLPVALIRSDPTAALGVAENDAVVGHFYSLGFGGTITLGFQNGIKSGVLIVESTNLPYPVETAKIEVSPDKKHWLTAGNLNRGGQLNVPERAGCIHYVRITDTSNPANFTDPTADGYDVDGVRGTGQSCTIKQQDDDDTATAARRRSKEAAGTPCERKEEGSSCVRGEYIRRWG